MLKLGRHYTNLAPIHHLTKKVRDQNLKGMCGQCLNFISFTYIDDDSSEEDPLDAFMEDLNKKTKQEQVKSSVKEEKSNKAKGVRQDIEEEDDEESYYRFIKENPNAGLQAEDSDGDQVEYDEDGNPIKLGKKIIDPLPAIDHSSIKYEPFEKNFYEEHEEIKTLTSEKVTELATTLGLKVTGAHLPKPVCSFAHFNFDEQLMNVIRKSEFTHPTPIQVRFPTLLQYRSC